MEKPFDGAFIHTMLSAAKYLSEEIQGFKMAYIQSDEASFLLTDYDKIDTQGWFDYNLAKMISISAARMSVSFNLLCLQNRVLIKGFGFFDSRAFNIPKEEVANYFLWRAKDWQRNSLQMYARSFFSHKELWNKSNSEVHEMLYGIGKNWATDLDDRLKNGSWLVSGQDWRHDILPSYKDISRIVDPLVEVH
jgi:tRNA(His) 5'-end guanylyltransferase